MADPRTIVTVVDFDAISSGVVEFVRAHQAWAPAITGALAFGESLAILSLLIPATVMLVAIGALIGATGLDFWPIWAGAAAGAFLGDWVSYEAARWIGPSVQHTWPLNRQPELIARTERITARWGAWGVFGGRFFGPLRALVPLVAGVFEMPRWKFQLANLLSGLVWAAGLLAPGAGLVGWLGR